MFKLDNGMRLGLWGKDTVAPEPTRPGGFEIGWPVTITVPSTDSPASGRSVA